MSSFSAAQRAFLFLAGAGVAFSAGLVAAEGEAPKGAPALPSFENAENLLQGADEENGNLQPEKSVKKTAKNRGEKTLKKTRLHALGEPKVLEMNEAIVGDAPVALPPVVVEKEGRIEEDLLEVKEDEEKLALLEGPKADVMPKARSYDRDMTETKYQCSPPSLSPHSLLKELTRQANRNQEEREAIETLSNELEDRRIALHDEIALLQLKIKEFQDAKKDLPPRPLTEEEKAAEKEKIDNDKAAKERLARERAEEKRRQKEKRAREKAAQVSQLSKAMRGMQAPEAALFLSSLETDLAADVLKGMRPKDAGAALAKMQPKVAAKLATRFTTRKALPVLDKKR